MRLAATKLASRNLALALTFGAFACGSSVDPASATPDGGAQDAGADGALTGEPFACDPAVEPRNSSKCITNEVAVFVDGAAGSDTNPGTKQAPVKSITAALGKLGGKPRVYICAGTYPEHVKLTAAASLYGGFACGSWSYMGEKAKVAPTDAGYALEIAKVTEPVVVADLAFTAQAGAEASPSSIAAFVNASPKVSLARVALTAGAGADGASPAAGAAGALMGGAPLTDLDGNKATGTTGGAPKTCTCVGGDTSKGGGGGNDGADGSPGETAFASPDPAGATGAAGTSADCVAGVGDHVVGRPGSNAPPAADGAGAASLGALTADGWVPAAGAAGEPAEAGQGGGGGGGAGGGGGGGGACGGCGGQGGGAGAGGGASVALLTFDSPVHLAACTLTSAAAGTGGTGAKGGAGTEGGNRGNGSGGACQGGNGGHGGDGGAGGGGAGGVSVGVLYKGPAPVLATTTVTTGAPGTKGPGGNPGTNDGPDGKQADTLEAP